jgi:hypothetical protein
VSSNFRLRAASWIVGWAIQVSNFEDLSKKKFQTLSVFFLRSNFECFGGILVHTGKHKLYSCLFT